MLRRQNDLLRPAHLPCRVSASRPTPAKIRCKARYERRCRADVSGDARPQARPQDMASHRSRPATGHGQPQGRMTTAVGMRTAAGTHTTALSEILRKMPRVWTQPQQRSHSNGYGHGHSHSDSNGHDHEPYIRAGGEQRKGIRVPPSGSLVCAIGMLNACWARRACTCRKEPESRWDVKHDASEHVRGII